MNNYLAWCQTHIQHFKTRRDSNKADCCCPVHEDRNPSMIVNLSTGWAECKSGNCAFSGPLRELAQRMGVSFEGVEQQKDWRAASTLGKADEEYVYKTAGGEKHARVLRFPGKKFRQQRWNAGDWEWKAPAFSLPYRLDRLHAAAPDRLILWVEGEKDVESAEWLGFTATTSPGGVDGVGRLDLQALGVLVGRTVVILPDNDDAGRRYAYRVQAMLRQVGAKASVLDLSRHWPKGEAPEKGDLTDWEGAGGTRAVLDGLVAGMASVVEGEGPREEVVEEAVPPPRRQHAQPKSTWQPPEEPVRLADGLLDLAKSIAAGKRDEGLIKTGLSELDRVIKGMRPQQLILLAARPGMGKSALAQEIAYNVAGSHGTVLSCSLEMSKEEVVLRSCAQILQVPIDEIDSDDTKPLEAWRLARDVPLWIYDRSTKLDDLRSLVDLMHDRHPDLCLIMVDYLGLVMNGAARDLNAEAGRVSAGLKQIAKDHKVPVLALSQLNRKVESRDDKRPMQSDLRDSGSLEQDADMIWLLYRDDYYNPDSEHKNIAELAIAKHRNGKTGHIYLKWRGETFSFFCLDTQHEPAPQRQARGRGGGRGGSRPQERPGSNFRPMDDEDTDTYGLPDY